jgi:release factor glutamine methyltransferase
LKQISQYLAVAQQQLQQTLTLQDDSARIEAQALLRVVMPSASRAWVIAHGNDELSSVQQSLFEAALKRRLAGEPIAYILGEREFYGLQFKVSPDVLIPRADTETLVEAALAEIPARLSCRILDLGTGSGIIAICLALHRPQARVTAIDRSPAALEIAGENKIKLKVENLTLLQSDWFAALGAEKFDVIVSNPPYIATGDAHLSQGDLRFEPQQALVSGGDGLDSIRRIIATAPPYLNAQGWLMLEHGYDQAGAVAAMMLNGGFKQVRSLPDLAGVPRVTCGRL